MPSAPFDLTGQVALVTGGNSGIGLGFAEGLAAAGADVCIWRTKEAKNVKAEETLKQYGKKVLAQQCDVSDREQVLACFAKTAETLGHVDSCFANAGIAGLGTKFSDVTLEEWQKIFSVNMEGVFHTLQTAANHKVQRRIPIRRWGTGGDFSGLAVYLASDASAYHSGDTIMFDGGYAAF